MYAIIEVGGKQEKIKEGDIVEVEKIAVDEGTAVNLDKVLLIADGERVDIGTPYVPNASVKVVVERQTRAKKLYVYKFKAKSRYRRKHGHRQYQSYIRIMKIERK